MLNLLQGERKGGKKTYKNKPKTIKKMAIGTYLWIITLNVNVLNAPTKKHKLANARPVYMLSARDPFET